MQSCKKMQLLQQRRKNQNAAVQSALSFAANLLKLKLSLIKIENNLVCC